MPSSGRSERKRWLKVREHGLTDHDLRAHGLRDPVFLKSAFSASAQLGFSISVRLSLVPKSHRNWSQTFYSQAHTGLGIFDYFYVAWSKFQSPHTSELKVRCVCCPSSMSASFCSEEHHRFFENLHSWGSGCSELGLDLGLALDLHSVVGSACSAKVFNRSSIFSSRRYSFLCFCISKLVLQT